MTKAEASVVTLGTERALDPRVVGAKGSALSRAMRAGLPVLEGLVISTDAVALIEAGRGLEDLPIELRAEIDLAYDLLSIYGERALVVRSSSTAEDGGTSSMAGMFLSVTDVRGREAFERAVTEVSATRRVGGSAPLAILIQPYFDCDVGGVMFGIDPISGDAERVVLVAAPGGPEDLVSGNETGENYVITKRGRVLSVPEKPLLTRAQLRELVRMSETARHHLGGAQDIEWGYRDGHLVMFQSRPVTATGSAPTGRIYGPGPVAETFPDALSPLEVDLWVEPMQRAIETAFKITGAASTRRLRTTPPVITVGGRVAVDLELFGLSPAPRSLWSRLDPRPPARRALAAWDVGRLRLALPALAREVVSEVDARLERVPDVRELSDERLLTVMLRSRDALVSLHGYEILCGVLLDPIDGPTAASVALAHLDSGRKSVWTHPETLALTPPHVGPPPRVPEGGPVLSESFGLEDLGPREALRLRIRWVQELSARAAWELGHRLVAARVLVSKDQIALLRSEEVENIVHAQNAALQIDDRAGFASPPLPSAFRLDADGHPVEVVTSHGERLGTGAGGGRGMGHVHLGKEPSHGDVLVVRTLDPQLAVLLPSLGGLVAETGSPLSHLAILAREMKVPTVVGFPNATEVFKNGSVIVVDGATGEVSEVVG